MTTTAEADTQRPHHNGAPLTAATDPAPAPILRRTATMDAAASAARRKSSIVMPRRDCTTAGTRDDRAAAIRSAERFLWAWVMLSMVISAAANATDSWLNAPEQLRVLATIRAFGPPVFIMVTTHIAGILIKMRQFGWPFVLSLVFDAVVSVLSFVLSYSAISHLMLMLGTAPEYCGLWPLAIDLMGVNAAMALVVVSYRRSRHSTATSDAPDARPQTSSDRLAVLDGVEPVSPSRRRQWWDSVAAAVQERNQYVRAISERSLREVADVLRLTHDDGVSQRAIVDVVGFNNRIVRAIQRAGDEVLNVDADTGTERRSG